MPAAHTAQPKIHSAAQNLPFFAAAGMRLFHVQYIVYSDIHLSHLSYSLICYYKL